MRVAFSVTRDRSREIIGRLGSNAHRGRAVEQPGEVAGDEATQGVADESAVLGEPAVGIVGGVRGEESVDDHRQDGYVGAADRAVDGDVDGGVLERGEAAFEHGLGQRADEVAATGCDLACPLRVVESGGAVSFVERVEPVGHAVAQRDGPAADRFGDGGVFALGVAGDVDAAAERDRAGVEALGEAGLAGADDAGEHEVRVR